MSIFLPGFLMVSAAGIATMTAALDRGDLNETARQGALAGPQVVERALHSKVRAEQLAGILAAPVVEDRAELLPALAAVAASADRRVAIPAADAARAIADELGHHELPDDLAPVDIGEWRSAWEAIAKDPDHFIEVRVRALDTAAALAGASGDPIGFDLAAFLADPDPDVRLVAVTLVPAPLPDGARPLVEKATHDTDPRVARAASRVLK
jgi:hypothetical protein